jgi:hypothetical protein
MRRLAILVGAGIIAALALTTSTASADPFYCDRVGPSISASVECGSTGVCYWEDLGNGLWLEKCLPYCDVYWCG